MYMECACFNSGEKFYGGRSFGLKKKTRAFPGWEYSREMYFTLNSQNLQCSFTDELYTAKMGESIIQKFPRDCFANVV